MAQVVTHLDEDTVVIIDRLVAAGVFKSRSDAVRQGLALLLDRRRMTGQEIVDGYRLQPQEGTRHPVARHRDGPNDHRRAVVTT